MSAEENKAIIERYIELAWNKGDWSVAEELVAEDVVLHDQIRDGGFPPGREGVRAAMEMFRTGSPDFTMELHDVIAEGDLVVMRWSARGTHSGELFGLPPTGRVVTVDAISIARLRDGRIVEGWQELDRFAFAQQLGFMPKRPMPRPIAQAIAFAVRTKDRLTARRAR